MLLVDAANVIGSRPDGWWRDRPGAASSFVAHVRAAMHAGRLAGPAVVVLEGAARRAVAEGVAEGVADGVTVMHASGSGDDMLISVAQEADYPVILVSADRELGRRAEAVGAEVVGPQWLIALLD
jgi:hypothetical protein